MKQGSKKLEKLLAFIFSWPFFLAGDLVSIIMNTRFTGELYFLYNKLMIISTELQEQAGNKTPWLEVTPQDKN